METNPEEGQFTRWCNEQLKATGKKVNELGVDFSDGLLLIELLGELTAAKNGAPDKIRYNKRPRTHAQRMENVQVALDIITKREQIYLVNIGAVDIVDGNLKLIIGMVWTLILNYQIQPIQGSGSSVAVKEFLLDLLNAVVPDRHVTNFTRDWNDGTALGALVDCCDPTLMLDFKSLDPANALDNCLRVMNLAEEKLNIPMVLSPEDMCNPHLDELSAMTYLSYFLKNDRLRWRATLNRVRKKVPDLDVQNFQSDWNDGRVLCALAEAVAEGACPEWRDLSADDKLANCQKGIEAGKKLGIKSMHRLSAQELTSPDVDELLVMSYADAFLSTPPAPRPKEAS